jgi:hypothetical protein
LPKFDKKRRINQQKVLVFDNNNVKYDTILSTICLSKTRIKLNYSEANMEWFDCSISLCPPGGLDSKEFDAMEDMFHIQVKNNLFGEDWLNCFVTKILDTKYEKTDVVEVTKGLTHLNAHQKEELLWVLQENNKMFDGTLGVYTHKKVHIDIDPNAKPVHSRPYSVPQIHLNTFKTELDHLVRIGVLASLLASQKESEWALPSFIIPKKDGRVCWISNSHQLNKVIRLKQYPLPIITDILRKHFGYKFFTKLDISMQYYMFELDKKSQDLCTIVTPFGKYKYLRLLMGLKCSPDIAQAAIENVLSDIEDAIIYIDDVGAFSSDWDQPLFWVNYAKMALPLAHSSVNGPSKKLTG